MKQKTIENDPCEAEYEECEANHEAEFLLFSGLEMRVRTLNYYYHVIKVVKQKTNLKRWENSV